MSVRDVKLSFMGCLQAQNRVDCEDDNKTKSSPPGLKFNIWFYSIYKHLTHFWLKPCLWQPGITRVICKKHYPAFAMCVCGRFTRCVKTIQAGRLRVYGFTGSPQTSRSEGCELRSIQGLRPPISHLEYWEPAARSMVSNQAETFFCLFACLPHF